MPEMAQAPTIEAGLAAHIAQYHLSHGNLDDARSALAQCLNSPVADPQEQAVLAEAYCNLVHAHIARHEPEQAQEAMSLARALADIPAVWRASASVATLQDDPSAAKQFLQRVAKAEPSNGVAWLALARACEAVGDISEAVTSYLHASRVAPSHATMLTVAARLSALDSQMAQPQPEHCVRIALLGSSTLEHLQAYLAVECRVAGLSPTFFMSAYGLYAQDILATESALYLFAPDVVILAVHGRALFPQLYDNFSDLDEDSRRQAAFEVVRSYAALLAQLTARTEAQVLVHTFATPQFSPLGIADLKDTFGQSALFHAINEGIAASVRQDFPSVHLVDEERLYGRVGKQHVTDPRLLYLARVGIGPGALRALAREYLRYLKVFKGLTRKCLVVDLDNTLWGGVVGEDGPHGIVLGHDGTGNAFRSFQEAIEHLWRRGIILAINSKNNEADALAVLEQHPEMVLRPRHFAAMRINWQDKASNIRSIAAELNIGLDSIVFMDDNPAECALVRSRVPEVLVVQLPPDPSYYRSTLLELTDFDTLVVTEEDRTRGQLYAQRRERLVWENSHTDNLDAYLAELELVVEVTRADQFTIPRVAQLIGKTNQFNLTTRRHSEATVHSFALSSDYRLFVVRVCDRFGDHGLVGTAIILLDEDIWVVDTFVLSCRVLGRGVETAFLSALVAMAREKGARTVRGLFRATAKNTPAAGFYARHAFTLQATSEEGQEWALDLRHQSVESPGWLSLRVQAEP